MKYFDFEGWDKDNSSSLNLIFGDKESLEKFSSHDFLELFEIDELEDEGELQKFEYPEYFSSGTLLKNSSEFHLFSFDGNLIELEGFLDRFNVDFVWHFSDKNFNLIHNHTLDGNDFDDAKSNFSASEKTSHLLITRVVSF